MRSPITIVVAPSGHHLSDANSGVTWCGEATGRWPTFALEPGSDYSDGPKDCPTCSKQWKAGAK